MDRLIIGSTALKHWYPEFRNPKDLDLISREPFMSEARQHYWVDSFQWFLDNNKDEKYLDADNLLTLKTSHCGWNIFWDKTVYDILFLKQRGHKVNREQYFRLVKDWTKVHGKKWAGLKGKDSKTFFEDAVKRKYVHDSIHKAIAVNGRPIYEKTITEGVMCSESLFNDLSEDERRLMTIEEIIATMLERYLVPNNYKYIVRKAYMQSLQKLATTLSSGWYKFYVLDNIDYFIKYRGYDELIEKFKQAESKGEVELCQK